MTAQGEAPTAAALLRELERLRQRLRAHEPPDVDVVAAVDAAAAMAARLTGAEREIRGHQHELESLHVELDAEQLRYSELFELAPDAYFVTDASGKVLEANLAAATLLGSEERFLLGDAFTASVEPSARRAFRQWLVELVRSRRPARRDVRLRRRDGTGFDASVAVAPAVRDDDEVVVLRWIVRDVTEDRETARRLRELNTELDRLVQERTAELRTQGALLEAVLEQLPVGVVIAAPSGAIRTANAYAQSLLGPLRSGATAADYPAFELRRADDGDSLAAHASPLARALRGERVRGELLELPGEPETTVVAAEAVQVRDDDGVPLAAVALFENVTGRHAVERAERAFVTNAAHELRTPLAAIASAIEVLQAGAKEAPDERDRFLDHIERESARLTRLAHALLVLARAEGRLEQPKLEVVPLQPLLKQVAAGLRPVPGVTVSVRCPRSAATLSSRELLEQALLNLGGNAARYTPSGRIVLAAWSRGGETVVEVRDTGPGIPEAELAHVFGRFYRGRRDQPGFGLGLVIARQAVEAFGGSIELESREGEGTTARLRLTPARLVEA